MKKDNKKRAIDKNGPSAHDIATRYGTYEIQPTADTENAFPAIAQGLSKRKTNSPNNHQPG
ncbi:MAG TPA: hypothetical protein DEW35_03435 [Ruminococcaceae bacterium]|nr:hypothetical protein [Oscillospiraceae bacterium]